MEESKLTPRQLSLTFQKRIGLAIIRRARENPDTRRRQGSIPVGQLASSMWLLRTNCATRSKYPPLLPCPLDVGESSNLRPQAFDRPVRIDLHQPTDYGIFLYFRCWPTTAVDATGKSRP